MPGQVFLFNTKARSNSTIDEVYCLHYFFLRQRTLMSKDRCYYYHGYWCWLHRRSVCLDQILESELPNNQISFLFLSQKKAEIPNKKSFLHLCLKYIKNPSSFLSLLIFLVHACTCVKMEEIVGKKYLLTSSLSPSIWT